MLLSPQEQKEKHRRSVKGYDEDYVQSTPFLLAAHPQLFVVEEYSKSRQQQKKRFLSASSPHLPSQLKRQRKTKLLVVVDVQNDFIDPTSGALPVPGATSIIPAMNNFFSSLDEEDYVGVLFTFDTHIEERYKVSEEAKLFPPHCIRGGWGWKLTVDPKLISSNIPLWKLEKEVFSMWEDPSNRVTPYRPSCFSSPCQCANSNDAPSSPCAYCSTRKGQGVNEGVESGKGEEEDEEDEDATQPVLEKFLQGLLQTTNLEEVEVVGVAADFCVKAAIQGFLSREFQVSVFSQLTMGIYHQINEVATQQLGNPSNLTIRIDMNNGNSNNNLLAPDCLRSSSSASAICSSLSSPPTSPCLRRSLLLPVPLS